MLPHPVGIQKFPADVHDRLTAPVHPQPTGIRDPGHQGRFEILFTGQRNESGGIGRGDHDRHPLLGLGNRQLGSIQPFILFRHSIQIDLEPGCQFADRHRHTAGAKIVAFLDQAADRRIAEQALNFPFGGRVSFLNFRTAGGQGFLRMRL